MSDPRTGDEILLSNRKKAKTEALLNGLPSQKARLQLIAKLEKAKRAKGRAFK